MVTTRSGKRASSVGKPRRSRHSSTPKKKKTMNQELRPNSADKTTLADSPMAPEIPHVNHNQDIASDIIDQLNTTPTPPETTLAAPILHHHDDTTNQFKVCGTENRPENPVAAVLDGSKPDDDNGYSSDDTCRTSNAATTHCKSILRDPSTPCRNKSFKVRFSTDKDTASTSAPIFSVGTPHRTLAKHRRGTPHPKPTRSTESSIPTTPNFESAKKPSSGPTKRNPPSSSIRTPQCPPSATTTSSSVAAKPIFLHPYYSAIATPPSKTSSATTPRSAITPRSKSSGVASLGSKPLGFNFATTPLFVPPSSTAETPTMMKSRLLTFTSARATRTKSQHRELCVASASTLRQRIQTRRSFIQDKKLRVCALMEELKKEEGDLNMLNAKQQQDRGRLALCKSRISTLEEQMAVESWTSPVSSKKRKSLGGVTDPIVLVSSSDDSSGNSGSDTDAPREAAVIHPSKIPRKSAGCPFVFAIGPQA